MFGNELFELELNRKEVGYIKRLFGMMSHIHRALSRDNRALFEEYGINHPQFQVLLLCRLAEEEGNKVCQKDIEHKICMRRSSVSTMVANLEKGGFIDRIVPESDARSKFLILTEKGREICEKSKLIIDKCDEKICSILTDDEVEEFNRLMEKIIENIN